jgi:hypothetical protein
MFFSRKPKSPLKEALSLAQQASEIVMQHKRDKSYMPYDNDLKLLQRIEDELRNAATVTSYVQRSLQQRQEGVPEGAAKFTNPDALDYHYPNK